jgi:hypothetical protein
VSVHRDDNHELVQLFDEVVSTQQPWQFATPCSHLPRIGAPTLIATFTNFQSQPPNTNVNLVPINSKMEQLQLLNMLEQLRHIN